MIQRRQHLRLAGKAREAIGILRERIGKNFNRDAAVEPGILGAVDGPHPALAELGGDAVMAN